MVSRKLELTPMKDRIDLVVLKKVNRTLELPPLKGRNLQVKKMHQRVGAW